MKASQIVALIFISLIVAPTVADATSDLYAKYCTNSTLASIQINDTQRTSSRAQGQQYYLNLTLLASLLSSNQNVSGIINNGAIIVCVIVLFVLVIITMLVLLGFCCCCDHYNNPTDRSAKFCVGGSIILLIVTLVFFILTMVSLSKFNSSISSSYCLIAKLAYDMQYGYITPSFTFIGLNKLKTVLVGFSQDLTNIQGLSNNFQQIINLRLPDSTAYAYNNLTTFYNQFKSSKTNDGTGTLSAPTSVSSMNQQIYSPIGTELSAYSVAGQTVHSAAQTGLNFVSGNGTAQYQSTINSATAQIDNLSLTVTNFSSSTGSAVNSTDKYVPVGLYVTIAFGAFLVLLFILACAIICCSISSHKNLCRCGVKLCLFIVALMLLILSLVAIVLYLASFVLGTICSAIPPMLAQTNITTWAQSYYANLTIDSSTDSLLTACLASGGSGDLTQALLGNSTDFSSVSGFIGNLSTYSQLKANFSSTGNYSMTIIATSNTWALLRDCLVPDQPNAVTALQSINQDVACGNQYLVFDQLNCTAGGSNTCYPVKQTAAWTSPSCSSKATANQQSFTNLKQYCSDQLTLLTSMIANLNDTTNQQTVGSQVFKYKKDFWTAFPLFDQVYAAMQVTVNNLANFTQGFGKSLNCTIVRQEILDFEAVTCFSTSSNLASLSNWLALFALFTLITIYGFCCSLRCTFSAENEIAYEVVENQPPDNALYARERLEKVG